MFRQSPNYLSSIRNSNLFAISCIRFTIAIIDKLNQNSDRTYTTDIRDIRGSIDRYFLQITCVESVFQTSNKF